ncbi:Phosphoglucosamine mutase [Turicibacter sanguinis]|nr:Phosphoglucosamine mutase [Turicibacter sanguinis]
MKLGHILGYQLKSRFQRPKVLIGRDTRISGEMLESALMAGLISSGVDVLKLGVITTPGVAHLTKKLDVEAGIMISASHNPVQDNGIKIFSHSGYKLSDAEELEIEALLDVVDELTRPSGKEIGRVENYHLGAKEYVEYLETTISYSLKGLKVILNCTNGASSALAPQLFKDFGAEVISIYHQPDGININESCGYTHP